MTLESRVLIDAPDLSCVLGPLSDEQHRVVLEIVRVIEGHLEAFMARRRTEEPGYRHLPAKVMLESLPSGQIKLTACAYSGQTCLGVELHTGNYWADWEPTSRPKVMDTTRWTAEAYLEVDCDDRYCAQATVFWAVVESQHGHRQDGDTWLGFSWPT